MLGTLVGAALGAAVAVAGAPVALFLMGFTGTGIAAGSIAAKIMSLVAIANGGGVPAGSLFAVMQRIGVIGLSRLCNVVLVGVGAAIGALFGT